MQEIANGTYNYQLLNEIMPMIYKRFTEKTAEEWRQIYKALQLLEFLVKNGSERVIDDARSHLTLLKMLRQFHYIDQNGKDQGINVRNRAKELTDLLSDVERIRAERKKSRATRQKYTGVEGGAGLGGSSSMASSSRYGGFSSEDMRAGAGGGGGYGGYSGGVFGDGGGFGGEQRSDFQDTGSRTDKFEEYDEYDDGGAVHAGRSRGSAGASSSSKPRAGAERTTATAKVKAPAAAPKPKAPEVDLFSFDDPIPTSSAPAAAPSQPHNDTDDDFDDFQSAPSAAPVNTPLAALQSPVPATTSTTNSFTQFASPQPVSAPKQADLSSMMGVASISPAPSNTATPVNYSAFAAPPQANKPQAPIHPTGYSGGQPNYFTSVKVPASAPAAAAAGAAMGGSQQAVKPAQKAAGGDVFGNLWQTASAGVKKTATPTQGPALGQLAKEKASAGIWGAGAPAQPASGSQQPPKTGSSGLDDLLG